MLPETFLVISAALLPLAYQPLRFEAHESHRAGLLLVLVAAVLPFVRLRIRRDAWPIAAAALLWAGALVGSTLLALSPSRAFWGDTIRRMGLLTQLALMLGLMLRPTLRLERWLWLGGMAAAVYIALQAVGLIDPGGNPLRPSGPLGVSVFTAGWLAMIALWVTLAPVDVPRWQRILRGGVLAGALVLTGSRGAALALIAGTLMAVLVWAAFYRAWRVMGGLLAALLLSAGLFALYQINWRNSVLADLPLLARLNPDSNDMTRRFREVAWQDTLIIGRTWPVLTTISGERDPSSVLRPAFGYGPESFETLLRPLVDDDLLKLDNRPIDRAHNDWLDTLVTTGWLGVLSRAALWASAWYVALRRLRLWGWGAALFPVIGGVAALLVSPMSAYGPLAMTLGALGGAGLWLLLSAFRLREVHPCFDRTAWVALAVLTVHLVDLQFGFTSVLTGWIGWLALGLLVTPQPEPDDRDKTHSPITTHQTRVWVGLADAAALWDIGLLLLAVWLLRGATAFSRRRAAIALIILVGGLSLYWLDTSANILFKQGVHTAEQDVHTDLEEMRTAAGRLPWDDRILAEAGDLAAMNAVTDINNRAGYLNESQKFLERAGILNPYDAMLALRLAFTSEQQADFTLLPQYRQQANQYFAAAVHLWPTNSTFWVAWAQFSLTTLHDPLAAYRQASAALRLDGQEGTAQSIWRRALDELARRQTLD